MDTAARALVLISLVTAFALGDATAQTAPAESADEAYRLAVGLHSMPLYKEAADKLSAFVGAYSTDPRLDMVHYRLGDCLVHLKKHGEALASFQVVVESYPESSVYPESLFRVGELNQFLGDEEKAVAAYDIFLQKCSDHQLAAAVREKEQAARIALLYRDIESDVPGTLAMSAKLARRNDQVGEEALFVGSSLMFNKGDFEGVVKQGKALVERFPESTHLDDVHLNVANALINLNKPDDSLVHLAAVKTTRMDEVYYLRGTVLVRQKATDKAADAFSQVVADHRNSRYRPYCLFELGALGQADAWQKLLDEYPKGELSDEVRYRQAAALSGEGKGPEALKLLSAIAADSARRTDADLLLTELLSAKDLGRARDLVASLEKRDVAPARLSRARYAVALAALEQGKAADALPQLAAILKDPQSKELHADCLYRTGLAQEQLKQTEQAGESYRQLVASYGNSSLVPHALLRLAAMLMEKKPDEALAALDKLTREHAGFEHVEKARELTSEIRYRKAWDAYQAKEYAAAADAFDQLKEHKTYGAESTYLSGVCYRNADNLPKAEASFAFLLQKHPDYEFVDDARNLLGELLSAQTKWKEAAAHYGAYAGSIEDPKARADAEMKQGMALYQLNQAPKARECLLYAADNGEPAVRAKALFFLGELLMTEKKHAEAKDYFLKVGVLYRHDELTPAALLEASKCLKATGDTEESRGLLERLVKEFPESPHSKEAGQMLKGMK